MPLPAAVTFLTVTAKMSRATSDGADADTDPDSIPLVGQATFKPDIGKLLYNGTRKGKGRISVAGELVTVDPVVVAFAAGEFTTKIIDPKCADLNSTDWTWTVTFALDDGTEQDPITFASPAGSQLVNLANEVTVEPSPGGVTFINEAAASAASAAVSAAAALAAQAAAEATPGIKGDTGLTGPVSTVPGPAGPYGGTVVTDPAIKALLDNPASQVATKLSATYVPGVIAVGAGIDPTGVADSTTAIQAKIDAVRDAVRATGLATNNVVVIPGGRYKISATIIQPPYVHVCTQGSVVIEWSGGNSTCWWVTPLAADPAPLYAGLEKQQYGDAALIDGNLILRSLAVVDGTSVGLEMGSRTDLGGSKPLKGYTVRGVSVQRFDTLQKMNTNNHYIASFEHCHLEMAGGLPATLTGTDLQIGTTGTANVNSGENIKFTNCLFAGAANILKIDTTGWDFNFNNCSFDFSDTVVRVTKGYGRVAFQGGHIEAINPTEVSTNGIVVSTVTDGYEYISFENTVMLVKHRSQIRGTNLVINGTIYDHPVAAYTNTVFPGAFFLDDSIQFADLRNLKVDYRRVLSDRGNRIPEPYFADEVVGAVAGDLVDWLIPDRSTCTVTVDALTPTTGKSVKIVVPPAGYVVFNAKTAIPMRSGHERNAAVAINTSAVGINVECSANYLKADGTAFTATASRSLGVAAVAAGSWRISDYTTDIPLTGILPERAVSVKPQIVVSNPTGASITVYVGYLYFGE